MDYRIDIETHGITEHKKAIETYPLFYDTHSVKAMEQSNQLVRAGWSAVAAVDTGFYSRGIISEINHFVGGTILAGRSFTNARSPKGFDYPAALEFSTRYHYRTHRFKGRETAAAVLNMFNKLTSPINNIWAAFQDRLLAHLDVN